MVAEQVLNNSNQTEENVWEYTFTGLKKYNEQAEEKKQLEKQISALQAKIKKDKTI